MSQQIKGHDDHFIFSIDMKNTNFVEDVEIMLLVKFLCIPFSGFREVENVSANQRPGRSSCFSDRPEKQKLGRGRYDLRHALQFSGKSVPIEPLLDTFIISVNVYCTHVITICTCFEI